MAMSGQPSSMYNGSRSPPRQMSGYHEQHSAISMYGPSPRPMPPPSPQHYQRYATQPPPPMPINAPYGQPQLPHKRPGSSMSISSMLGAEPERPSHDPYYHHARSSSHGQPLSMSSGPPPSLSTIMSPPQYPPRSNPQEYSYKPRATTPDRYGDSNSNRYRSGSGSMVQRPGPFAETAPRYDHFPPSRYQEDPQFGPSIPVRDEAAERARRTSLSGILQRPESAPQRPATNGHTSLPRAGSTAPFPTNGDPYASRNLPVERSIPPAKSYDTQPPPFNSRPPPVRAYEKRDAQSLSPELRRAIPNGMENRSFNGILNDSLASQNMVRQESAQSQSSAYGDRYRPRPFSPFAPSVTSQASMAADEYGRKGSDEFSHRAILGLANESRRGRYSPVPQAVQGAQAQTPTPDTGVKAEQGRVFAGLGGGLGSGPTSTPVGLSSSPFKEGAVRLSEENLMKMSRSTSGMGKRSRKFDQDIRAESEAGDGKKGRKRSKYAHTQETARRGTPLSMPAQRSNATSNPTAVAQHRTEPQRPLFKPKQTIRTLAVMNAAKRLPRRHLGTFRYDPKVSTAASAKSVPTKYDLSIYPNALPSFDEKSQVNCTYSIRVPRLWLKERERCLVGQSRMLWGSGIYTDDSDVVAAAMHSGFMKSSPPENADKNLLDLIAHDQTPRLEGMSDIPDRPLVPEANKDAIITCVVLPQLEEYVSSTRYGIRSRSWPDTSNGISSKPTIPSTNTGTAAHDGVSFTILSIEFVNGCVEARRMGRTGKERRERIKKEQAERAKGKKLVNQIMERVKLKRAAATAGGMSKNSKVVKLSQQQPKNGKNNGGNSYRKEVAEKAAMGSYKEKMRVEEERRRKGANVGEVVVENGTVSVGVNGTTADDAALDVGQAPGEWLKQLETSAGDA